jgi:hypothetical protein
MSNSMYNIYHAFIITPNLHTKKQLKTDGVGGMQIARLLYHYENNPA